MSGGNRSKSFCVLPFMHLATHPIGTVTPCCITDMTNDISTAKKGEFNMFLGKDSLDSIANSDRFKEIRHQMINGEQPHVCRNCFAQELNKVQSKRQESNSKFKHLIEECFTNTNLDGSLKEVDYRYLELRLGSVCNLKCNTCNSFSSNRWNQDIDAFKGSEFEYYHFKNDIKTDWYRSKEFYDELFTKSENLEEIWINGGEPTIIVEHKYFLDKLINSGRAKNITLNYSINLTALPDSYIERWRQFKKVHLQLSIDDLYERNDYIRSGSEWDIIYKNLQKAKKEKSFGLEIIQTVSLYNIYNIDKFKKFTIDEGLPIGHNYVSYPMFLHVSLLPDDRKQEILNNIQYLDEHEKIKLQFELNKTEFKEKYSFNSFTRYVNILDKKRNTDISKYLPEYETL